MIPFLGVLFDGFAYGMLLFLLSVGLSVTLGMMNFVNLAHCSFAMIGAYVTITLTQTYGWPFLATLPMAFLAAAVVSVVLERTLFQRFYRATDLDQCLLTIGIVFVSIAVMAYLYGTILQSVQVPPYLKGSFDVGPMRFGVYRTFLIFVALAVAVLLVVALEKTRFGAQIRAAVDNQRMARGLGIDVDRTFALTFALGSGLAGLGGALAIEMVGLDTDFAFRYLIYVLIVVSVGGLGSIGGSFAAAVLLGVSDVAGKYYAPQFGAFFIYAVMIVLLMWRPQGLFGRR
jgi:branched-chain amino acid transport system permease protein